MRPVIYLFLTVFAISHQGFATAEKVVALTKDGKATCFAYSLSVPLGEPDAVLTTGECSDGEVSLVQKNGSVVETLGVQDELDLESKARLAVLRFPEGTIEAAAQYAPKTRKLLPGAPVFDKDGGVIALTNECQLVDKKVDCSSIAIKSEPVTDFLSLVEDDIWGDSIIAQGDDHKFCWLTRRRRSRGFGGFRRVSFGYSRSVSVSIRVNVVVVSRPVHIHHHHYHGPSVNVNNSTINNSNLIAGSGGGSTSGGSSSSGGSYSPPRSSGCSTTSCRRSYSPPPPPPAPAYVGLYEHSRGTQMVTNQLKGEVAQSSTELRQARRAEELKIARALPSENINNQFSTQYALALNAPSKLPQGEWIASRDSLVGSSEFLIASNDRNLGFGTLRGSFGR